jgi:WD40 repeat protein
MPGGGVDGGDGVSLSADGRRVATSVFVAGQAWNVGSARPIVAAGPTGGTDTSSSDSGLSPDGRWFAITSPDNGMTVIDLDNKRRVTLGRGRKLYEPTFSKDGGRIYTTVANGALWSYDRRTGAARQVLVSREVGSRVSPHVSFTGFTTERFADRVAVVELSSGSQVELLGPFRAGVRTAEIAPDGTRVAILTEDGTLRVFGCPTCSPLPDLLAQARQRLADAP